jgi:hypothetical protein
MVMYSLDILYFLVMKIDLFIPYVQKSWIFICRTFTINWEWTPALMFPRPRYISHSSFKNHSPHFFHDFTLKKILLLLLKKKHMYLINNYKSRWLKWRSECLFYRQQNLSDSSYHKSFIHCKASNNLIPESYSLNSRTSSYFR